MNFVVFAAFVDTRCKHHNILVVNRVDYTGLDFCALAGVEADASCGYGSATSPACAVGAQSLRPLRWAKRGPPFRPHGLAGRFRVAASIPVVAFSFF